MPNEDEMLTDEEIEKINQKYGDIISMVMDFKCNEITAGKLMEKISERCNAFAQAQLAKLQPLIQQAKRETAREISDVYDDYLKLLGEELNELAGIAAVHGWKTRRFEEGNKHRIIIQATKDKYGAGK